MHVRLVASALLGLALMTVPALAQTQPFGRSLGAGSAGASARSRAGASRAHNRRPHPSRSRPSRRSRLSRSRLRKRPRSIACWACGNSGTASVKTFDCEFKRWTYDVIFGPPNQPKFIDTGIIKYAAPDRGMFRVEKTEKDGKDVPIEDARAEHWISDGKSIFEYNHTKKQLTEHKLPPELQGKAIADSPLPFLFGADTQKLKQRYWIRIVTPADVKDKIFLEAYPRYQQDAANFYRAEFIIMTEGMAPYALNLVQPNKKDRIAYQFYNIVVNDPLRLFKGDPFRAGLLPGWQKIIEEPPPAAQVRRPSNDGRR